MTFNIGAGIALCMSGFNMVVGEYTRSVAWLAVTLLWSVWRDVQRIRDAQESKP